MSDEHIIQKSLGGTFQVRYNEDLQSFTFQMTVVAALDIPMTIHSVINLEEAAFLSSFIQRKISSDDLARMFIMNDLHIFEPHNPDWAKPRCKVCREFEEHPIHTKDYYG